MKGVLIFSAPSGSGKTTILQKIFARYPDYFGFSVSATNRSPRDGEKDGISYYFLSTEEFESKVKANEFLEWEEVYEGRYYGTLSSELDRIWSEGKIVVFDVDVLGGVNIKSLLKDDAVSIFIMPPSVEELKKRLELRGTETNETLSQRIGRAEMEITMAEKFDYVVVNDDLDRAVSEVEEKILSSLEKWGIKK